jgi:uroporphyrin-III C-methyltransferase / precorrin-2 dehydrogenase / sirohydrochlorin ferrochelatase
VNKRTEIRMRYFPVFYDLADRTVVVVGGGEEALRKIRLILKTPARIQVVARELHAELVNHPRVEWVAKIFIPELLDGAALVFSAEPPLNETVSAAALARGILVNAVDEAEISNFIVPSIVDRDPVVVAIGTEGAAPVLAQNLRAKIDGLLPLNLGAVARRAAGLRHLVAEKIAAGNKRRAFWADFFFGSVAEARKENDEVAYELALGDAVFNHAHAAMGRITFIIPPQDIELLTLKAHRRLMEADVISFEAGVSPALLEMARRDAVRVPSASEAELSGFIAQGLYVVHIGQSQPRSAMGAVEVLRHATVLNVPQAFPIREAVLKAAS